MTIVHQIFKLHTDAALGIYNITPQIRQFLASSKIRNGYALVMSQHTTTAISINEDEPRLLDDIKDYLTKLAPPNDRYLHNDLHLRDNIPDDEPMNAHSHLMAMTLSTSEMIPIVDGALALGTYQSVLLLELDGPRHRTVFCQIAGEF